MLTLTTHRLLWVPPREEGNKNNNNNNNNNNTKSKSKPIFLHLHKIRNSGGDGTSRNVCADVSTSITTEAGFFNRSPKICISLINNTNNNNNNNNNNNR